MGLQHVHARYEQNKATEIAGGRLMFRGLFRMVVAFVVLWAAVAAIGFLAPSRPAADHHGAPAHHRTGR